MAKVLLIDDDERLGGPLAAYFQRYDLSLETATHPEQGLERLNQGDIDLVILDVMLPDRDGFDVCRAVRKTSEIPILMLTARGDVMDRVIGLELGADDYLAKPFEPRELVARVQNILRRAAPSARTEAASQKNAEQLRFERLTIDLALRQVSVDGRPVELTTTEYRLLALLAQHAGRSLSRDEILNHLRGIDADIYSRAVDILVSRVRQKIKPLNYIKTVWGAGYSFIGPPA